MGLCEKIPVFGGCGDIPAIAIGAGCSSIGSAHIYLGSSGWLAISVPERKAGVGELYQSFDRGKELLLYVMQAACMAQNWAVKQFYRAEENLLKDGIFQFVDRDIADISPGCGRMVATPWLHGELPPLSNEARMVFFNITNLHDRRHMMKAVLEGICFSLRWKIEMYGAQTGKTLDVIRVVGGAACSDQWMQSLANILGIPVAIPENAAHAGAIGTAYCAIVGLGLCPDFHAADKMIREEKVFAPDPACKGLYGEIYGVYKDLYPSTRHLFETLNRVH
jgi:xylulokinase